MSGDLESSRQALSISTMYSQDQTSICFQSTQLKSYPHSHYSNPSIQIHIFLYIFSSFDHIKTLSGDLERSHCALSISTIAKAKYRSFVNRLN